MQIISVKECAERLGLTKQAIIHRITLGKIDATKDENGVWQVLDNEKLELKKNKKTFAKKTPREQISKLAQIPELENKGGSTLQLDKGVELEERGTSRLDPDKISNEGISGEDPIHVEVTPGMFTSQVWQGLASLLAITFAIWSLWRMEKAESRLDKLAKSESEQMHSMLQQQMVTTNPDKKEIQDRIGKAVRFLRTEQHDGAWLNNPGVTSLCVMALAKSKCVKEVERKSIIESGMRYLLENQNPDGSFDIQNGHLSLKNYCTSLAILAMEEVDSDKYQKPISRARAHLRRAQFGERNNVGQEHSYFGGVGYDGDQRPDLGNLHMALEALKSSRGTEKAYMDKALVFLNRCQATEYNDMRLDDAHGGFYYSPEMARYDSTHETKGALINGGLAFNGLESLIFCNVDSRDTRYVNALKWIQGNFSVKENPGMGQVSVYYYYYMMSKVLSAIQLEEIVLPEGQKIRWKQELAAELLARQQPDGSWVNSEKRYMEGHPLIATAYALNSLNLIQDRSAI